MLPVTHLRQQEAIELAGAFAARVAEKAGIRALLIKGLAAARTGLRPGRIPSDADLLVEPARVGELLEIYARHGWRPRPIPDSFPRALPWHARTLWHEGWPVDIDVHWYWPGMLADPADVFTRLWERRRMTVMAGVPVATTGEADTVLVLALHSLREAKVLPADDHRMIEYSQLIAEIGHRPGLADEVLAAARTVGAVQTALPLLRALGFDIAEEPGDEGLRRWRLHASSPDPVSSWVDAVFAAPCWRRPAIVWRAVFPSAAELRAIDPLITDDPRSLHRGWWRRFRRGLRTIRGAVRAVRQSRS